MILQALNDYYQRKMRDPDPARRLPAFGLEEKEIPFILDITRDGRLAAIKDTRAGEGKRKVAARYLVPKGVKKTSGVVANLLWDNAEYVLAIPDAKKLAQAREKNKGDEYIARLQEMQAAFKARLTALPEQVRDDEGVRAVLAFLDRGVLESDRAGEAWKEIENSNPTLTFRLAVDDDLICQRPTVASVLVDDSEDNEEAADVPGQELATCLVTGTTARPERVHTAIKGVWGAQTSGANIVSFNLEAFDSFGKEQGANAPVGQHAAFAYTTALNHLLMKGSRQRMQVGDASTVFWAQKESDAEVEQWFADAFGDIRDADDPDTRTNQIRALYESVSTGRFDGARGVSRFYVLGLAPNAARIAVRFWHASTVAEVGHRIRAWFEDLKIERAPHDPEYPTLFRLLTSAAVLGKADNIPPGFAGDLMRSALDDTTLPTPLLNAVVQRCRADQARKSDAGSPLPNVNYHRAALLKAGLNRLIRLNRLDGKEIDVALDPDNTAPAYLAGRLFAAYEKVQADVAERDLNRTIRDTYFGAAMSNPATVFPRLAQLNQHHMRDLRRSKPGLHTVRDRLIGEIWGQLPADKLFPQHQPLAERARFALGYYHQRQAFFLRAEPNPQGGN